MEVEISNLNKTIEVCQPVKVSSVWNSERSVMIIIPWLNNTEVSVIVDGKELIQAVKQILSGT